jgi:ketosteroid isomerase-like protein
LEGTWHGAGEGPYGPYEFEERIERRGRWLVSRADVYQPGSDERIYAPITVLGHDEEGRLTLRFFDTAGEFAFTGHAEGESLLFRWNKGEAWRRISYTRNLDGSITTAYSAHVPPQVQGIAQFTARWLRGPRASDSLRVSVGRFYRSWSEALRKDHALGYAAWFAPDAALLPPHAPAVLGRDSIRVWADRELFAGKRTVRPTRFLQDDLRLEGDWTLSRLTLGGTRSAGPGLEERPFETKYLDLLRRRSGGGWEFLVRMWSENRPDSTQ